MKKIFRFFPMAALVFILNACNTSNESTTTESKDAVAKSGGQEAVQDDVSQKDVVKIAVGSKDHTTLVAALKQAEYVDDLSNAGPFTVFAPTNDAFKKLPAGTLEGLMKDDKKSDLQNILEYHVAVGVYKNENMQDGQKINMANLNDITLSVKDGKVMVNGTANVVASIPAANGIIHVVDAVLLPPAKN
ncbi:MAG TPA: fasciclin domain-containing protein [Chitinophagaceae bacterium]|nr:fasciclin domain-containing protein [Chitinophagaceae bacterium]